MQKFQFNTIQVLKRRRHQHNGSTDENKITKFDIASKKSYPIIFSGNFVAILKLNTLIFIFINVEISSLCTTVRHVRCSKSFSNTLTFLLPEKDVLRSIFLFCFVFVSFYFLVLFLLLFYPFFIFKNIFLSTYGIFIEILLSCSKSVEFFH